MYPLKMLVDSNKVISILFLFLMELNKVYPEQLLFIHQLDSQNFFLSLSSRTASPLGPTPFDAVANLHSSYGMSSCFVSLHPY